MLMVNTVFFFALSPALCVLEHELEIIRWGRDRKEEGMSVTRGIGDCFSSLRVQEEDYDTRAYDGTIIFLMIDVHRGIWLGDTLRFLIS